MNKWHLAQFLEKKWWYYYLKSKDLDDYLFKKKKYWHSFLDQINIHPAKDASIIDLGCGPAGIFTICGEHPKITGVDPLLDFYKLKFKAILDVYVNVEFVKSTLELYSPKQTYEFVFCLNAINHVKDIDRCMNQIKSCGDESSVFIISSDIHRHSFAKRFLKLIPIDMLHPKQMDNYEFEQLLNRHGFGIVEKKIMSKKFLFNYEVYILKKL